MGMTIIGVTGGIGAGKSSVSSILKDLGAVVIDADQLSKQVVEPGKPAWHKIKDLFGEGILREDQRIDRQRLAKIVFHSGAKRLELEAVVHAEVTREMKKTLDALEKSHFSGVAVLDVPIPVEHGFLDTADRIWVVVCDDEERIRRVMERSGISREEAESRIKSQLSQEEYIKLSDDVIVNDKDVNDLRKTVETMYQRLMNEEKS